MAQLDFAVYEDGLLNFFDDVPEAVDRYETLIREVQLEEEVGLNTTSSSNIKTSISARSILRWSICPLWPSEPVPFGLLSWFLPRLSTIPCALLWTRP